MASSVSENGTITFDFTDRGPLRFKPDLGIVPFHLGCNALVKHPNCGICHPELYTQK